MFSSCLQSSGHLRPPPCARLSFLLPNLATCEAVLPPRSGCSPLPSPLLPSVGKRLKGLRRWRRWRHLMNAASHSSSHFSSSDTLSVETLKLFVTLSLAVVCCSDLLWLIWLLSYYCVSSYIWLKFCVCACVCFHTIKKYLMP